MFLVDSNVLITAQNTYYSIEMVPEFWDWLLHHARADRLKVPAEMVAELVAGSPPLGRHPLVDWVRAGDTRAALTLPGDSDPGVVADVAERCYAPLLQEQEVARIGMDPFIVAHALRDRADRCVVTNEVSAPGQVRGKRKMPDACAIMGVKSCHTFALLAQLGFSTGWRGRQG